MTRIGCHRRAPVLAGIVAVLALALTMPATAGFRDSVFFISPDGTRVAFDVHNVARREVFDQLLANKGNKGILLRWKDEALAEEPISGTFSGTIDEVLQRLLADFEFEAVYGLKGDKSRIGQLTIGGRTAAPRPSGLADIRGATPPPVAALAPVLTAVQGDAGFRPASASDAAVVLLRPAASEIAPPLVPPALAERAAPLVVEPAEKGK